MHFYIALGVAGAGLVGMFFIIVKKFPQLANLDLENLPEEKEAKKKKEIMERRVEAEGQRLLFGFMKRMEPVRKLWGKLQLRFRIYVGQIERLFHYEQKKNKVVSKPPTAEAVMEEESKLMTCLKDGALNLEKGNLEKAEELFIAAIKIDVKNAVAYRGLADTYLAEGALDEAKETYEFLLQLQPKDDAAMTKLSELFEKKGDIESAITYLQQAAIINDSLSSRFYHIAELLLKVNQPEVAREAVIQAVELEPKNPKYLDLLIETAILCVDKDLALRGFEDLRAVNPDNQKLDTFKQRIKVLA